MSKQYFNSGNVNVNGDVNVEGTTRVNEFILNGNTLPFTNWTNGNETFTGDGQQTYLISNVIHNLGGEPTFASGIVLNGNTTTDNFAVTIDSWNANVIDYRVAVMSGNVFSSTNSLYWSAFR